MTKLHAVATLYETNARSIPDMMRQSAESIESETDDHDRTKAMIAVQITEEGKVEVYGWGQTDTFHAITALNLGAAQMVQDQLELSE